MGVLVIKQEVLEVLDEVQVFTNGVRGVFREVLVTLEGIIVATGVLGEVLGVSWMVQVIL